MLPQEKIKMAGKLKGMGRFQSDNRKKSEAKAARDRARKKLMLKTKMEGLRKKGDVYDKAIKKLSLQEKAAKGLSIPHRALGAIVGGGIVEGAKAAAKAAGKSAVSRVAKKKKKK